jgi:hypothetical protein
MNVEEKYMRQAHAIEIDVKKNDTQECKSKLIRMQSRRRATMLLSHAERKLHRML